MSKSNTLETELLNYVLRGQALTTLSAATTPANVWVALFTADPTDAGSGAEVAYTSYARVAVSRATGSWSAPADNAGAMRSTNAAAITFPASTGGGAQTVTHFGLMSAATAGTLLYHGALTVAQTINVGGSAPEFAIGALAVSEA